VDENALNTKRVFPCI